MRHLLIGFAIIGTVCGGTAGMAQEPKTNGEGGLLLFDARPLAEAKRGLAAGDKALQPALDRLIAEADDALDDGPFSVTDKTVDPPSGDRHDYMSRAPYWWPDPKKKDGLPYVRKDGEVNPESRGDASDSPRMSRMVGTANALALAYHFTGDEKYAARAALLLRTWFLDPKTRMNPHLEYGQAIPGRVTGRGVGIIDTARLTNVPDAAILIEPSRAWTDADHAGLKAWFAAYLKWLRTSRHGRDESRAANNHGTWYDVQVACFALFAGERDVAKQVLAQAGAKRITPQVQPDGRQPHELARTRSFSYSVYNLSAMFDLARLGEHVGVDLWRLPSKDRPLIRAALDYLARYADPEREWPHKQIGELDRTRLLPFLHRAARAWDAAAYRKLIETLPADQVRARRCRLLWPLPNAEKPANSLEPRG